MLKKLFDGILIGIGIFFSLSILLGIVYAIGFHQADEIIGGAFNGNFIFNDNVTFNGKVIGLGTEAINENASNNLIRIGDLQILWGSISTGTSGASIIFSESFIETPEVVASSNERSGYICSTGNGGVSETTAT